MAACWSGGGLYDVSASFVLIGAKRYSFNLPSNGDEVVMTVEPGTYKVSSIIASGRDGKNGSISFLDATPSSERITVVAGEHQFISIELSAPAGGGSFIP